MSYIDQAEVIRIMQDAISTIVIAALPMMAVALIIGIIISIFQAATQINEQTLAFVPKIIGIFLTLLLFAGFIFSTVQGFTERLFGYINSMIT